VWTKRKNTNPNPHFAQELVALLTFREKRGIISLISGGIYRRKYAIFLPAYECSLSQYLKQPPFLLSLEEKLNMISQWLEGLATLSEKGIHGDLKPDNLLLKRGEEGVEAVIGDFGTYRIYGKEEYGLTTIAVRSPEYSGERIVIVVWGMGISLHEIFSQKQFPCWDFTKEDVRLWTSGLTPGWVLEFPTHPHTPPFILQLINEMLDPRQDHRLTAKEVFERFSVGYSSFVKPDAPTAEKVPSEALPPSLL